MSAPDTSPSASLLESRDDLPVGLHLRAVRNEDDIERYASFNTVYNNPQEGTTAACLLRHHPFTTPDDYWLIEDEHTGEIVSTTCLLPWTCRFAGIALRVAQLEMVLTRPDYRRRGLVRVQMGRFARKVLEQGYDLSLIWGIPFYYRQYGYAYAIYGDMAESLPAWKLPAPLPDDLISCRVRPAILADVPRLTEFYERLIQPLDFAVTRSPAYWEYLLKAAKYPVEIVEDAQTGEALGYVITRYSAGRAFIQEHSLARMETALAFLDILRAQGIQEILIAWPKETLLVQLARSLGSQPVSGGQWLLRIADILAFLHKIGPVLETRLEGSAWQGLTLDVLINLYRQAYTLRFSRGRLLQVIPQGFVDSSMGADGGHLCIPPEAFVRLVFGFRQLDELTDAWPDIVVKPQIRHLLNTLFPPLKAYLSTPYHYWAVP